jgi:pimeloyl-ACP methyl ester carboxylesterase
MAEALDNTMKEFRKESFFDWVTETYGAHHTRLARAAAQRMLATTMAAEVPQGPLLGAAGLTRIGCPVLSIVGDAGFQKDDLTGLEAALPDCITEVMPGQDHSVLVNAHKAVRRLVLGWVGEHSAPGRVRAATP